MKQIFDPLGKKRVRARVRVSSRFFSRFMVFDDVTPRFWLLEEFKLDLYFEVNNYSFEEKKF